MKEIYCQQTHSNNVKIVTNNEKRKVILNCDGLLTSSKNIKLCIKTSDCLPITFRSKNMIGVVHAGWRGLQNKIILKAVKLIKNKLNIKPTDINIKIGPSIDRDNYLVKMDLYKIFKDKYSKHFIQVDNSQWKMDLKGIAIDQLQSCGVLLNKIKVSKISTYKNLKYPSFRRDGKTKGFVTSAMLK